MKNIGSKVIERSEDAFNNQERLNQEKVWSEISTYILGGGDQGFTGKSSKGQDNTRKVQDSTAINANQNLSAMIHYTITNPATKWNNTKFKDPALNRDPEAKAWLQDSMNRIHADIISSNFDSMVSRSYPMITACGNMIVFQDTNPDGTFRFSSWHLSEVAFYEGVNGTVDTIYRKSEHSIRYLIDSFPDVVLPESVMKRFVKKPEELLEVITEIKPRSASKVEMNTDGTAPPRKRPFSVRYVLKEGGTLLKEDGFYELPFYAVRWSTLAGHTYGQGAGHTALQDTRYLNKMKDLTLKAKVLAVNPPILINRRAVAGNLNLTAGKANVVKDIDGLRPWHQGADTAQTDRGILDLRDAIKAAFFLDKLILPPRTETGEQTAYEIQERMSQMQKVLAPTTSRIYDEFLKPMTIRSFKMKMRAGGLAEMPQILKERGVNIDIKFVNPLTRSQRLEEISNMMTWARQLGEYAQITGDQSALDWLDGDFIASESAEIRSLPEGAMRTKKEVEETRAQRQQAQQQQAQMEQAQQMGGVAKDLGGMEGIEGMM